MTPEWSDRIPISIKPLSLYRPELRPPTLGWIDPLKEVQAAELAVRNGFKARAQVIRDLGGDPRAVDQLLAEDEFVQEAQEQQAEPQREPADDEQDDAEEQAE